MYEKEQFVQSVILLAVLTAISFSCSAARIILPAAAYLAFSSAAERTAFAMRGWGILRYFYNISQTPAAGFFGSFESGRTAHILLGALLLFAAALSVQLKEQ